MYAFVDHPINFAGPWEESSKQMKDNYAELMAEDAEAREGGSLLGRVIRHPIADGYAYYQIIKVNAKTVRIRVCDGLGDDWILPAWGGECTVSKATAQSFVGQQDEFAKLFSGRK